jgi:microcystin degradation protein MlrC
MLYFYNQDCTLTVGGEESGSWGSRAYVGLHLTERKTPPFDLAQLRGVGVIPEAQKMIVVKSAVAYRAAYLPIAAGVVEMDTAGLCSANLGRFPYRHLGRPIFPLDGALIDEE